MHILLLSCESVESHHPTPTTSQIATLTGTVPPYKEMTSETRWCKEVHKKLIAGRAVGPGAGVPIEAAAGGLVVGGESWPALTADLPWSSMSQIGPFKGGWR